jgi:hypothetical protein
MVARVHALGVLVELQLAKCCSTGMHANELELAVMIGLN